MPDDEDDIEVFKYAEKLPVALDGYTNLYEYADLCYTNMLVDINDDKLYKLYKTEGKVLEFLLIILLMVSHQAIGIYYKFILSDVAFLINYVSERKGKHRQV